MGAGRMGLALATRLLEAGCDVAVYNRTRAKAEPLADLGATIVDAPAELADRYIVFTTAGGAERLPAGADRARGAAIRGRATPRGRGRLDHDLGRGLGHRPRRGGEARYGAPRRPGERKPQGGQGGPADHGHLRARVGSRSRPSVPQHHGGRRGDLCRRRRARAPGKGVPQPDARDRLPVAGRDPRAGRKGRHLSRRHDGVPQQQRARFHLHPLQDTGLREPRFLAHIHPAAPAQGLRPRLRGGARARGADAGGDGRPAGRAGLDRPRLHRRRLRRADRAPGQCIGTRARIRIRTGLGRPGARG